MKKSLEQLKQDLVEAKKEMTYIFSQRKTKTRGRHYASDNVTKPTWYETHQKIKQIKLRINQQKQREWQKKFK